MYSLGLIKHGKILLISLVIQEWDTTAQLLDSIECWQRMLEKVEALYTGGGILKHVVIF